MKVLLLVSVCLLATAFAAHADEYEGEHFPETRSRVLSLNDVSTFSFGKVRYALNEIYARHGYDFPNSEIKAVFKRYKWYVENFRPGSKPEEIEAELTETEAANLKLLGALRDQLKKGPARNSASTPEIAEQRPPPAIRAWWTFDYRYPARGLVRHPQEEDDDHSTPTISAREREDLPVSSIKDGDEVIIGESKYAPLSASIKLQSSSNGGAVLIVDVIDTRSGRSLDGFPVAHEKALTVLNGTTNSDDEEEGWTPDWGLIIDLSQCDDLVKSARAWIVRDENEDRGLPNIDEAELHIRLVTGKNN